MCEIDQIASIDSNIWQEDYFHSSKLATILEEAKRKSKFHIRSS